MPDVETRLVGCFLTVFPQLTEADVRNASQERLEEWDSVAAITLVNVIEEEFTTQIDYDNMANLDSFAKVLGYLTVDQGLS